MLDVPRELVTYVARLLAKEQCVRGTRRVSRALTCWPQASFALVWFRKRQDITVLGSEFGISPATAYRYHDEAVAVLTGQAPDLTKAMHRVHAERGLDEQLGRLPHVDAVRLEPQHGGGGVDVGVHATPADQLAGVTGDIAGQRLRGQRREPNPVGRLVPRTWESLSRPSNR